jgi:cytochrome c oxidase subunit 2
VHNTFLETVWTIIPSAILILISIPSFILLYAADLDSEYINAQRPYIIQDSNKVKIIKFDSYMLAEEYLNKKKPYSFLEVDNSLLFVQEPGEVYLYTLKVSSRGVLHSWVLPVFEVKSDACSGFFKKTGIEIYSINEHKHVGGGWYYADDRGAISNLIRNQDFLMWIYVYNEETTS